MQGEYDTTDNKTRPWAQVVIAGRVKDSKITWGSLISNGRFSWMWAPIQISNYQSCYLITFIYGKDPAKTSWLTVQDVFIFESGLVPRPSFHDRGLLWIKIRVPITNWPGLDELWPSLALALRQIMRCFLGLACGQSNPLFSLRPSYFLVCVFLTEPNPLLGFFVLIPFSIRFDGQLPQRYPKQYPRFVHVLNPNSTEQNLNYQKN